MRRFVQKQQLVKDYKLLKKHLVNMFERIEQLNENMKDYPNREKMMFEAFDDPASQAMYNDLWELLQHFLASEEEKAKRSKKLQKQQKELAKTNRVLKEQAELGFEDGDEDSFENDVRKLYKTIMCPLKTSCPKAKMLRWPTSNIKSHQKFGKDCPFAHHPMELQFPETLKTRMSANKKLIKQDKGHQDKPKRGDFVCPGSLMECNSGCGRCNICLFKKKAQEVLDQFAIKSKNRPSVVDMDAIAEKKKEQDESRDLFFKKFGILKKASVLMFYDRYNDAFDEIAKAAQIIKN